MILLDPKHETAKVGRSVKTYTKLLTEDTSLQLEDLPKAMEDGLVERKSQFNPGKIPDTISLKAYNFY